MKQALSFDMATSLAEKYQYLIGEKFCGEYKELGNIECVAVSPYSDLHKSYFLEYYIAFRDAQKALSFFREATEFDVVLISGSDNFSLRDLKAHLAYQESKTRHLELN